jgi:hypothetical protein
MSLGCAVEHNTGINIGCPLEMSGLENVRIYSLRIINSHKKEDVHISVLCQAKLGAAV